MSVQSRDAHATTTKDSMFPKAYIFYTVPNVTMYFHVKTDATSNVKLNEYSPYMDHHLDVRHMWDVASFQHPETFFEYVLVVPNVDLNSLSYAHLAKTNEAIYCVKSESDLMLLESISDQIQRYGPDYSRMSRNNHSPLSPISTLGVLFEDQHELIHEAIHEHFIRSQIPV